MDTKKETVLSQHSLFKFTININTSTNCLYSKKRCHLSQTTAVRDIKTRC